MKHEFDDADNGVRFEVRDNRELGIIVTQNAYVEIARTRKLPPYCDRLYLILCSSLVAKDASVKSLSATSGYPERTIQRGIQKLKEAGLIEVQYRRSATNPNLNETNVYNLTPISRWGVVTVAHQGGVSSAPNLNTNTVNLNTQVNSNKQVVTVNLSGPFGEKSPNDPASENPKAGDSAIGKDGARPSIFAQKETQFPDGSPFSLARPMPKSPNVPQPQPPQAKKAVVPAKPKIVPMTPEIKTPEIKTPDVMVSENSVPVPAREYKAGELVWYRDSVAGIVAGMTTGKVRMLFVGAIGELCDKTYAVSQIRPREQRFETDTKLEAWMKEKAEKSQGHERRVALMVAWTKKTKKAYAPGVLETDVLLREKGGIFAKLDGLNLTPTEIACAADIFMAWWEFQRPVLRTDAASAVVDIERAAMTCMRGFGVADVAECMATLLEDKFWGNKPVTFEKMIEYLTVNHKASKPIPTKVVGLEGITYNDVQEIAGHFWDVRNEIERLATHIAFNDMQGNMAEVEKATKELESAKNLRQHILDVLKLNGKELVNNGTEFRTIQQN